MNKGKFFVFEGIDGCGGETQMNKLAEHLEKKNIPSIKLSYPDYTGPIGELIHRYLHKEYEFSKEVQFLLFLGDFLKDKEKIQQWLHEGKVIIADRYFTAALAYQCFEGILLEHALQIAKLLEVPIPDAVLYLRVSADTSIARKTQEKQGNLDRNESNRQFLSSLVHSYNSLSEQNTFAPWQTVDGEQSIEEVEKTIYDSIVKKLI
jgi:dTMP kinase